jgi:hypothetical protein
MYNIRHNENKKGGESHTDRENSSMSGLRDIEEINEDDPDYIIRKIQKELNMKPNENHKSKVSDSDDESIVYKDDKKHSKTYRTDDIELMLKELKNDEKDAKKDYIDIPNNDIKVEKNIDLGESKDIWNFSFLSIDKEFLKPIENSAKDGNGFKEKEIDDVKCFVNSR